MQQILDAEKITCHNAATLNVARYDLGLVLQNPELTEVKEAATVEQRIPMDATAKHSMGSGRPALARHHGSPRGELVVEGVTPGLIFFALGQHLVKIHNCFAMRVTGPPSCHLLAVVNLGDFLRQPTMSKEVQAVVVSARVTHRLNVCALPTTLIYSPKGSRLTMG